MTAPRTTFVAIGMPVASVVMLVAPVRAEIARTSGDIELVEAPASVEAGAYESDSAIRVFPESEAPLGADVLVDAVTSGRWDVESVPTSGVVAEDTPVRVYMMHFDNVGDAVRRFATGSVTFRTDVLGLLFDCHPIDEECVGLDATDRALGNPATAYPTGGELRGLELFQTDEIALSDDRRTVTVTAGSLNRTDQVRVIVAASAVDHDAGVTGPRPGDAPAGYTFDGGGGCRCRVGPAPGAPPRPGLVLLAGCFLLRARRRPPSTPAR